MKKTIIALATAFVPLNNTFCQDTIDVNILGITIGKTLNIQALRILKNKGFRVGTKAMSFRENPEEHPITLNDTISHIGHIWNKEVLNSSADKTVYRICLIQDNQATKQIDKEYNECKTELNNLYNKFIIDSTNYHCTFSDSYTEISLWKTSDSSLRLCYQAISIPEEEK